MSSDSDRNDVAVRNTFCSPWHGFGLLDMDRICRNLTRFPFEYPRFFDSDWRTPLSEMNFDSENDEIHLTLEMPGINKEDMNVSIEENQVKIKAETKNRKYVRNYSFPRKLDPEKARANYTNGILELVLKMAEADEGYVVEVE